MMWALTVTFLMELSRALNEIVYIKYLEIGPEHLISVSHCDYWFIASTVRVFKAKSEN